MYIQHEKEIYNMADISAYYLITYINTEYIQSEFILICTLLMLHRYVYILRGILAGGSANIPLIYVLYMCCIITPVRVLLYNTYKVHR